MEMLGEKISPWNRTALFAETGSKGSSCEWETPAGLFNRINKEFQFDLDAAAGKHNTKCEKFFCESFSKSSLYIMWTYLTL